MLIFVVPDDDDDAGEQSHTGENPFAVDSLQITYRRTTTGGGGGGATDERRTTFQGKSMLIDVFCSFICF